MNITILRTSTNPLYTMGELHINGSRHSYTVESTAIMLPAGEYIVRIVKHSERKQSISIFPVHPDIIDPAAMTIIATGHSWKDCRKENKIAIGTPLMPGAIYKGINDLERLTDRLTKAMQRNETLHLTISEKDVEPWEAIGWWSTHPMHGCPATQQEVTVDPDGNVTVTYNNGSSRFFPVPEENA